MKALEQVAFLSLGSNLGDRAGVLLSAIRAIAADPQVSLSIPQDVASLYETAPIGGPAGQPRFLNTVVRLLTGYAAHDLLRATMDIESSLGRIRQERWGARAIDVDLLLFGEMVIEGQSLTVPHPRLHERRFMLEPLAEIAAQVVHPRLGLTILQLAQVARTAAEPDEVIRVAGPEWVLAAEAATR